MFADIFVAAILPASVEVDATPSIITEPDVGAAPAASRGASGLRSGAAGLRVHTCRCSGHPWLERCLAADV